VIGRNRDPTSEGCKTQGSLGPAIRDPSGRREPFGESQEADPIERWGRFVGRVLGLIFLVGLISNLMFHWLF